MIHRINFALGSLLLLGLFVFFMQDGGYRLPRYFAEDGAVLPIGHDYGPEIHTGRLLSIDGLPATLAPILYEDSLPVIVETEAGTGLMRKVPNDVWSVAFDFKFLILFAFIFLWTGFWFLATGNDFHLAALCFVFTAVFFTAVTSWGYHQFGLIRQIALFALVPAVLNMGLRTTGKEVSGYLLLGELVCLIFFSLVAYVGQNNPVTIQNLREVSFGLHYVVVGMVVLLQGNNALSSTEDPIVRRKNWVLLAGTLLGYLAPNFLYKYHALWTDEDPMTVVFLLQGILPVTLIYSTYRIQILPFQFVLTRSILAGLLTLLFALVYGGVLLVHSLLLPEQEEQYQWIVHVIFLLILVFFLDPARKRISAVLERRIFRLSPELTTSLEYLAKSISSPLKIQTAARTFLTELERTLDVTRVQFILASDLFPELSLRFGQILRRSPRSPFWNYLRPDRITVTSYLTYGAGVRAELFRYLLKNNVYMAIGVSNPASSSFLRDNSLMPDFRLLTRGRGEPVNIRAAILFGPRRDRRKFRLTEIRYMQEAARLVGMLIFNYSLLAQEIEKRRRMREINLAGQVQRSIAGSVETPVRGVRISSFNVPVLSVTGDYLDLIPLETRRLAFFLGDVSGHGLGTGYLVSAMRSIVRSHLQSGAKLRETVETLNLFLMERYQGNEFITLFALILNTETGETEYINAAHPGPFLKTPEQHDLIRLQDSQRLLGILPRPYTSSHIKLHPGQRLILYSDGVPETFNPDEEAYGDRRLTQFIREHGDGSPEEITDAMQRELVTFRGDQPRSDDTTFVVMEFQPRAAGVRGLLSLLGLENR